MHRTTLSMMIEPLLTMMMMMMMMMMTNTPSDIVPLRVRGID